MNAANTLTLPFSLCDLGNVVQEIFFAATQMQGGFSPMGAELKCRHDAALQVLKEDAT